MGHNPALALTGVFYKQEGETLSIVMVIQGYLDTKCITLGKRKDLT